MVLNQRAPHAQSLMEYVLLITLIVTAVVVMFPYIKRSTQSLIKTAADQISDQQGSEQDSAYNGLGYVASSNTFTNTQKSDLRSDSWGWIVQNSDELVTTKTEALINAGFRPD